MKNVIKGAIAIALLGMVSCAKDYTCECDVTHEQSGTGFSETKEWNETADMTGKEDDMKSACSDMSFEESYTDGAGYSQKVKHECSLR